MPTHEGLCLLIAQSGIAQQAEEDIGIGTITPAERIELRDGDMSESAGPEPRECLLKNGNVSVSVVRQARVVCKDQDHIRRKQKLQNLLVKEHDNFPVLTTYKTMLLSLLDKYHDVFSLKEGEQRETDLVQLHINAGDAQPQTQSTHCMRKEVAHQL